ncbi:MAG: cyclase family protein [Candidatus Gastranaerophilales bacterium]|nr:cyclase family protein [Candidatus Gastranaerophilales bacterium]
MEKIFDVTLTLKENITVYPDDPTFNIEYLAKTVTDGYNLTKIDLCSHTGTHIDAPAHFIQDGASIDELPLDVLIGKVLVLDFTNVDFIDLQNLKSIDLDKYKRILFKTSNSNILEKNIFSKNYTYITPEAAQYLVKKDIRLIGFDYYTIDKYNSNNLSHKILLKNNVIIIETINLNGINAGEYELIALPLKIKAEGSPARVILRRK